MHHRNTFSLFFIPLCAALLLSGCGQNEASPVISFVGVGTGTLTTSLNSVQFNDRFRTSDNALLGVVAFSSVKDGTTVQATWFSPDDRRMPLGRSQILIASGATVARFSLASKANWSPAPYLLHIDAFQGEGEKRRTASGSTQFFIGMSEKEIGEYRKVYEEWRRRDAEERRVAEMQEELNEQRESAAKNAMSSDVAVQALRRDIDGNGQIDTAYLDTTDQPEFLFSQDPALPLSTTTRQLVVLNGSGETILSLLKERKGYSFRSHKDLLQTFGTRETESLRVSLSISGVWQVTWTQGKEACVMEFRHDGSMFVSDAPVCESQRSS